jgi:hypothetical protein
VVRCSILSQIRSRRVILESDITKAHTKTAQQGRQKTYNFEPSSLALSVTTIAPPVMNKNTVENTTSNFFPWSTVSNLANKKYSKSEYTWRESSRTQTVPRDPNSSTLLH